MGKKILMKKEKKVISNNNIYFVYSLNYVIFAIAVFIIFALKRKTFVWLDDGISQNIIELKSSAEFLKNLLIRDTHYYFHYSLIDNNIIFRFFYWGIRNILGLLVEDNQYVFL